MGYSLQCLGSCALQTRPCCFAYTTLETPQKIFCLRPWLTVATKNLSCFHTCLYDKQLVWICSPLVFASMTYCNVGKVIGWCYNCMYILYGMFLWKKNHVLARVSWVSFVWTVNSVIQFGQGHFWWWRQMSLGELIYSLEHLTSFDHSGVVVLVWHSKPDKDEEILLSLLELHGTHTFALYTMVMHLHGCYDYHNWFIIEVLNCSMPWYSA